MRSTLRHRFAQRTRILVGDCWGWTGAKNNSGYGTLTDGKTRLMAHRISYELHKGPIPEGMEIDHLCRNRWCVNPDHLSVVTHAENQRRREILTLFSGHCRAGHTMDDANTYRSPQGYARCRTCARDYARERYARQRLAA